MRVWIVRNGGLGAKFEEQANLHHFALLAAGAVSTVVDSRSILTSNEHLIEVGGELVETDDLPDVVINQTKDTLLASTFEGLGVEVICSSSSIALCDDKRLTHRALARYDLPSPTTVFAPQLYPRQPFPDHLVDHVVARLGLPLVIKEARGSFGNAVHLATTAAEVRTRANNAKDRPILFQRYVKSSHGRDLRIHVIGGRVVAALERRSVDGDIRANLTLGAVGVPYHPSETECRLAVAAAEAVGAASAGVDILFGSGDERLICEVNTNAHIARASDITGVDLAGELALWITGEHRSR